MGRWTSERLRSVMNRHLTADSMADGIVSEINTDCDAYEARIAELEAMLADEVAENVRLRSREVGDEVGNLLQEVADLKNELARVKAESLRVVKDS